jgi:hypothetical protein
LNELFIYNPSKSSTRNQRGYISVDQLDVGLSIRIHRQSSNVRSLANKKKNLSSKVELHTNANSSNSTLLVVTNEKTNQPNQMHTSPCTFVLAFNSSKLLPLQNTNWNIFLACFKKCPPYSTTITYKPHEHDT